MSSAGTRSTATIASRASAPCCTSASDQRRCRRKPTLFTKTVSGASHFLSLDRQLNFVTSSSILPDVE
jgi:hypothetical protein